MTSGGHNKKPAAQHRGNGTYRKDRHATPTLPVEAPVMPPDLTGRAQAAWNVLSRQLVEMGVVASVDMAALRLLCESFAVYLEAEDAIKARGILIEEETKNGTRTTMNPACRVRATAWNQVAAMLRQFGLTPAARTGIPFDQQAENDEEQEVAEILRMPG